MWVPDHTRAVEVWLNKCIHKSLLKSFESNLVFLYKTLVLRYFLCKPTLPYIPLLGIHSRLIQDKSPLSIV